MISVCLGGALISRGVSARDYGVVLQMREREDLYAYEASGELEPSQVATLIELWDTPLDLNRASVDELFELPGMSLFLARKIVEARTAHENFEALDELGALGVSASIRAEIAPFVVIKKPLRPRALRAKLRWVAARRWRREASSGATRGQLAESYLRAGLASPRWGSGILVSTRPGIRIDYRPELFSYGGFVGEELPAAYPRFDGFYAWWRWGSFKVVAGSYNVGFSERLTLNTTPYARPYGWYAGLAMTEDAARGALRPRDSLFGLAADFLSGSEAADWRTELSVFVSSKVDDLYQGDFSYAGESPDFCDDDLRVGGSDINFRCALDRGDRREDAPLAETFDFVADGRYRSQRIFQAQHVDAGFENARQEAFGHQTIVRAHRETLAGAHAGLRYQDSLTLGFTTYRARTDFRYPAGSKPDFSPSNSQGQPLSVWGDYGALGGSLRWRLSSVELGAEFSRSTGVNAGHGVIVRLGSAPVDQLELELLARRYGPHFVNPHSNPTAHRDELFGSAARNERGLRARSTLRWGENFSLRGSVDYSQNPHLVFLTRDRFVAEKRPVPLDDLVSRLRSDFELGERSRLALDVGYARRMLRSLDLDRASYLEGGDSCGAAIVRQNRDGQRVSDCASGSRWSLSTGAVTELSRRIQLQGRLDLARQRHGPRARSAHAFVYDGQAALGMVAQVSEMARMGVRVRGEPRRVLEQGRWRRSGRARLAFDANWEQRIGPLWSLRARYGLGRYVPYGHHREHSARIDHVVRLVLEASWSRSARR